jgi:hypothetical protein
MASCGASRWSISCGTRFPILGAGTQLPLPSALEFLNNLNQALPEFMRGKLTGFE